jgi:hypothetical protein
LNWLTAQRGDSIIDAVVVNTGRRGVPAPDIAGVPAALIDA